MSGARSLRTKSGAGSRRKARGPEKKRNVPGEAPVLCPIVGVGASAGGLEAFERLLRHLPDNLGLGYVLVTHLEPTHESHLTEILSRGTRMPVTEVKEGMRVEPDHVYIIPPNTIMTLREYVLQLVPRQPAVGQHMPIDLFFHSLAEAQKHRALGVILSGTASDGAAGMKAIKVAGGITFAQDAQSAKYYGMPQSSIAAGAVDFILPPEGIAEELERIGRDPYFRAIRVEEAETVAPGPELDADLREILALMQKSSGVDFTQYKRSTVLRRIRRRMTLRSFAAFKDYLGYLKDHPAELGSLYKDMFINVSGFFREPEAFRRLQRVVFTDLLKKRPSDSPIRVWVPGCSTGEEAYSIAIALLEFLRQRRSNVQVQIFATDVSEEAIHMARNARYLRETRTQVEPARLRRWFTKTEDGYHINKVIRDLVVFAKQDITKDAPFSRLDLISCRNLLIYLGPVLQKKLIPLFHYALKPNGYLFLGAAETVGPFTDLFSLADKKHKIYSKKPALLRHHFEGNAVRFELQPIGRLVEAEPKDTKPATEALKEAADLMLLNEFTPPSVLVNEEMEILQFRGRTGPYLEPASGSPTMNVLKMARAGLLPDLQAALHESQQKSISVRREGVRVNQDGERRVVNLQVVPLKTPFSRERCYLIAFQEVLGLPPRRPAKGRNRQRMTAAEEASGERISQLKQELSATKAYLESVIDKHEGANEELHSLNEEIMSSNEELQSTGEELETANEELQSANEELTTLNEELHTRYQELTRANNDVLNILGSMSLDLIILDPELRIRRFTPTAEVLFNLISTDVGRPISQIRLKVTLPNLEEKIRAITEGAAPIIEEVQGEDGKWYSMQVRPYVTAEKEIDGVVLAVADISALVKQNTDLKQAIAERENAQRELQEVHRRLLDAAISRERDALAREIHDSLSQVLAGAIVQLEAAEDLIQPDQADLKAHVTRARDVAREGLERTRKTAWAWRTGELSKVGELPAALDQLGHRLFDSTPVALHLSLSPDRQPLPPPKAGNLLMFAQEALANTLLHSGATDVWVNLWDENATTRLTIRDNGKGFDLTAARKGSGFGLLSMQERVEQMGGELLIETAPGQGTTIGARVPNPKAETN